MKAKTRQELANEYGVSRKTFYNWLKRERIVLEQRLICPKEIEYIYDVFGNPNLDYREKYNGSSPGNKFF